MGRRHQVFLIARLVPKGSETGQAYYRCIGARHHQWCWGILPQRALHRFITLIKNPNNAEIIRDEIRGMQGEYGRQGDKTPVPLMPCPYTLLLLSMAWNMDFESPEFAYASGTGFDCHILPPELSSFGGDNNDGITVIDVTDPSDPGYCFVYSSGEPPVDARGYICHYTEETSPTVHESEIADLDHIRLLTAQELAEVWPNEYLVFATPGSGEAETSTEDVAPELENHCQTVPSLVDLAFAPALEHALATDDTEQFEETLWMPGKADLTKRVLMTQNPLCNCGMRLLIKLLTKELRSTSRFILDLSVFPFLSSEQVEFLIKTLSNSGVDVKSLNLSGNHHTSVQTVVVALSSYPSLLRLVLLNTSIADDQLLDLMSTSPKLFYNLYDLVHPAFLRATETKFIGLPEAETLHSAYNHGFSFVVADDTIRFFASTPLFHPEKLLKTLVRHMPILIWHEETNNTFFRWKYADSGFAPLLALSTGTTLVQGMESQEF
ncbi:hypothetical protein VKT23_016971 [Stygiomarasmius scandens]|uniref:Uncharacterized protein n=1 Tax=Marasmiellus scandens TaxID=2682957 RepID=A0ABR1ITF6_9AGAR